MAVNADSLERMYALTRAKAVSGAASVDEFTSLPWVDSGETRWTRAIYIGGAGDVVLTTTGGDTVTLAGVTAGTLYPISVNWINSTSTATNIIALA